MASIEEGTPDRGLWARWVSQKYIGLVAAVAINQRSGFCHRPQTTWIKFGVRYLLREGTAVGLDSVY